MMARNASVALAGLCLLVACQTMPGAQDVAGKRDESSARMLAAVKPSNPTEIECKTDRDPDKLTKRCRVDVVVTWEYGLCNVKDVPNVALTGGKGAILVWDLPKDFVFCPALGDGVFLRNAEDVKDDSFDDFGSPDDGAGNNSFKKCRNRFRVFAENVSPGNNKKYFYVLQFHHRDNSNNIEGAACVVDPFIKNG